MANSSCDEEFELVPRMRIDFNVLPVDGQVRYEYYSIQTLIVIHMYRLVGHDVRPEVHLHQTHPPVYTGLESLDSAKHEKQLNQLKYGDPGFFFVRDLTFVDHFPGNDWGQKFYNARQFIVREMHCKRGNGQLLLTHLKPSEDAARLINLISDDSTPTLILKGLLPYEFADDEPSTLKLRNFFHSLGRLRDFHISRMNVSIRFEDCEECCKAIKNLCSHSLKKNGNSSIFFDYELTFEDSLGFNASQDIDNESPTSQALKQRMAMLEKELKTVKAIFEKNVDAPYNYPIKVPLTTIHVSKNRVAMLGKEFSTLKPLIERSGAGDNESPATQLHQVAILEKESNALKALLEESSVCYTETPATQALKRQFEMLEHRLSLLEREDKRKRRMNDHGHHDIGINNNMAMYNMMGDLGGTMRYDQRSGFPDNGGASSSSMPLQFPMVGPNNFPLPWQWQYQMFYQ